MQKQHLLARSIRCLLLAAWFIAGTAHATASIPVDVAESLRKGTSQDVLIVFDDTAIRNAAAALRKQLRVWTDTAAVQTLRAQRIADLKARAFAGLNPGSYEILREYPHIAMRFVRFSDLQVLLTLASHPEIIGVFKDHMSSSISRIAWRRLAPSI